MRHAPCSRLSSEQSPNTIWIFDITRLIGYRIALLWNVELNTRINDLIKIVDDNRVGLIAVKQLKEINIIQIGLDVRPISEFKIATYKNMAIRY